MTANIVNQSSTPLNEKNEWRTPPEVFRWASKLVGGFDYDTACRNCNALAPPIWTYTGHFDALLVSWDGSGAAWCNPPYDDIDPWSNKAIASSCVTALLVPSVNGEARYASLIRAAHEIVIIGRLAFLRPDGTPVSGNTRGSSLFVINGYGQGSRSFVERDWIMEKYKQ